MENDEEPSRDVPFASPQTSEDQLSTGLKAVGCSPFKISRVGERDRKGYAKRKLSQVNDKYEELLLPYGLETEEEESCNKCSDLDCLVHEFCEICPKWWEQSEHQVHILYVSVLFIRM